MSLYFLKWRLVRLWPFKRFLISYSFLVVYLVGLALSGFTGNKDFLLVGWMGWAVFMSITVTSMFKDVRDRRTRNRLSRTCPVCRGSRNLWGTTHDAENKARALLFEYLTPQQRVDWRSGHFFVKGGVTGHVYELIGETVIEVDLKPCGGRRLFHYCINPKRTCGCHWPKGDSILAKLLMIRYDERRFLSIAIRRPWSYWSPHYSSVVDPAWNAADWSALTERRLS